MASLDVDKAQRFGIRGTDELILWLWENGLDANDVCSLERETCDGNFLVAECYLKNEHGARYFVGREVATEKVTVVERVPPPERILAALEAE